MTWLLLNIPLMILFLALWTGIPLWLVRKHPDAKPTLAATLNASIPAASHSHGPADPRPAPAEHDGGPEGQIIMAFRAAHSPAWRD